MRRKEPFPGVGEAEMRARIQDARLSDQDAIIAELALIRCMDFAEIAPYAHCERSTVSRHYKRIIEVI
jgi:hypothetical protein